MALNRVLVEQFIASQKRPPAERVLDADASDIPLHGDQEQRQFHAYYDHYCYLPLYVYCGQSLLACVLRRSRIDGAKHAAAVIKRLVTRLRQAWPDVRIVVRGDSGFCRQRLIRWCERHRVGYIIGVARNARLHKIVEGWEQEMEARYAESGVKQRRILELRYAADSWNIERRIVTRLEFGTQGPTPVSSSPISICLRKRSTTISTASVARPRTGSRKRSWICSAPAPVATSFSPTGCACSWPGWPTR